MAINEVVSRLAYKIAAGKQLYDSLIYAKIGIKVDIDFLGGFKFGKEGRNKTDWFSSDYYLFVIGMHEKLIDGEGNSDNDFILGLL